ncbi:MAG: DNA primase, partial [Minisyncoccia bacterium]
VQLRKTPEIVDYLLGRGLTKETMIKFRIGYVPDAWREIYDYLKSKQFTDIEIERAGLAVPKKGSGYYDRFRSRIMFPLFDGRGRVVGFSGRIYGDNHDVAKYINSPEGPLFDKSRVLYGYHAAKSAMSKSDYCILVEGQLDVLLSQQSGYENTVAISGTGLTDEHIEMVKRFTDTVYLALDSDKAGIKATRRSVIVAYKHNMRVKVILLNEGEDPADTIKRSKESWDVALMEPLDYVDYRIRLLEKQNPDFEAKQTLAQRDLFELVSFTRSATTQDHMLQKIALFLGTPVDAVRRDFEMYTPDEVLETIPEISVEKNTEPTNYHKQLLMYVHYIDETFHDEYLSVQKEISEKYKNIFDTEISDDLMNIS